MLGCMVGVNISTEVIIFNYCHTSYLGVEAAIFHLCGHRIYHHVLYLFCKDIHLCSRLCVTPVCFGLSVLGWGTAGCLSIGLLLVGKSGSHFASLSSVFHIDVNFNAWKSIGGGQSLKRFFQSTVLNGSILLYTLKVSVMLYFAM